MNISTDSENSDKSENSENPFGNLENGSSLILFVRRDTKIDKLCHNDCEQKALTPVSD